MDASEDEIIAYIAAEFDQEVGGGWGIGDDCALVPAMGSGFLVTTDLLTEGTHFKREWTSSEDLGFKSLAVNLSDIAASGGGEGTPYAFLSLSLPNDLKQGWWQGFMKGFAQCASAFGVKLVGGDTTRSEHHITVSVAVMAKAKHPIHRRDAKPEDVLVVTGSLGDSAAGLDLLFSGAPVPQTQASLIERHIRPTPHLNEARWLCEQGIHGMIDLSDGIAADLPRLCKVANCGYHLDLDQLPLSGALIEFAQLHGKSAREYAWRGGEDYVLLASLPQQSFPNISRAFEERFGRPLTAVGKLTVKGEGVFQGSAPIDLSAPFFSHFSR